MVTTQGMLVELLDLERIEVDIFRGRSPDENLQGVFGGQVAGQALVAAGPSCALLTCLFHPARRSRSPDRLYRRPHPGWPLVHHPPGGGGPERTRDLSRSG
jgi:hypothetical protein